MNVGSVSTGNKYNDTLLRGIPPMLNPLILAVHPDVPTGKPVGIGIVGLVVLLIVSVN